MLAIHKDGQLFASGHDQGFNMFSINKVKTPCIILESNIFMYAKNMDISMYDVDKKIWKTDLYQYIPKNTNSIGCIRKLFANPFHNDYYIIQIQ
jgi:phosphatidate phosphatase PAH1